MDRLPFLATTAAAPYDNIAQLPVVMLLDHVRSAYNVGAFFRTADGVRLERLILCGITPRPDQAGVAKTALGAAAPAQPAQPARKRRRDQQHPQLSSGEERLSSLIEIPLKKRNSASKRSTS